MFSSIVGYTVLIHHARLSRSSALASKATGYPLAYTAAKIALGHTLPELPNAVTKTTTACFEPSLDYIVTKIPKWDLAKFSTEVNREVGSAMKSVGEVMAIGRTFEESLQKAIRMVDPRWRGFEVVGGLEKLAEPAALERALERPTDMRLFAIAYALYNDKYNVQEVHDLTKIDKVRSAHLCSLSMLIVLSVVPIHNRKYREHISGPFLPREPLGCSVVPHDDRKATRIF